MRARVTIGLAVLFAAACDPSTTIGRLADAGGRCDPLTNDGCTGQRCMLAPDPADDRCLPDGSLAPGAPCDAPNGCTGGAQCARRDGDDARLDEASVAAGGRCLVVCARDAPTCEPGQRCLSVRTTAGSVRIDFGVCD